MDDARLAEVLAYCKLTELADDPEVQTLIPSLYNAAITYLFGAGITRTEVDCPRISLYDLAVNYFVLAAWERRETAMVATVVADNPYFRWMINQLKLTEPEVGA